MFGGPGNGKKLSIIYRNLALAASYPEDGVAPVRLAVERLYPYACAISKKFSSPASAFVEGIASMTDARLQEHYTDTFDFNDKNTLYLTFHDYRDSKKRGMALVELTEISKSAGVAPKERELPDHLPGLMEIAAAYLEKGEVAPLKRLIERFLDKPLAKVHGALVESKSPYGHLIGFVSELNNYIINLPTEGTNG